MVSSDRPKLIFLLAPRGRSGTNYLFRLISHHSRIAGVTIPFWEDFLLHEAHHLKTYADSVFAHWAEVAGDSASPVVRDDLKRRLGDTLCHFLAGQIDVPFAVTKTPSVQNIDLVDQFFPEEKLIILIRDGRDVVASGMLSFDWTLEGGAASWAKAAKKVLNYCEHVPAERRLIMHYESLVADPRAELERVFAYVGADPGHYDWRAEGLDDMIGSSSLRQTRNALHWLPVEKPKDFNPVGRWQSWSQAEKQAFDERAGEQLLAMNALT